MLNIGIIGSGGRMGQTLDRHTELLTDMQVSARLEVNEPLAPFVASAPDVVVDFSLGGAVEKHGPDLVAAGLSYIVGATAIPVPVIERLAELAQAHGTPVLIVPNFSIGANLMMHCAGLAARLMHSPVIIERHHQGKADAPSGTARLTAERIAAAIDGAKSGDAAPSTADDFREQMPGVMGGRHGKVAVHSVRGAGYLAEQEVSFSLPGETLRIEHRSIDRRCFMPGVEYAIRNIGRVTGLQIGLDSIFDL